MVNCGTQLMICILIHLVLWSASFVTAQGVRQGGVLCGFLYIVYINELLQDIEYVFPNFGKPNAYISNPSYADNIACLNDSPKRLQEKKGRDRTQSYDKSPYTNRNVKRAKRQHKQRHKKVRLHSADRLRTVSWSNNSHPTGVINLVYGPNLPTPRNSRVIKRSHV